MSDSTLMLTENNSAPIIYSQTIAVTSLRMAVLIKRGMSMLFSSDVAAGAENVSADGTQFSVTLDSPLSIPKGAMNCSMAVIASTIWNTSPNIAASFGNNLFRYQTSIGGGD